MTTTHDPAAAQEPAPTTPPTPAPGGQRATVRQQRRPMMIGLGVALLALGGLGGGWLATQGGQTVSVLTVRTSVPAGHRISASDLGTTQLNKSADVTAMPASDSDQVIGRYATSKLPAGTLLTSSLTTPKITPADGRAIVGVALSPSQMPATGLHADDNITLVVGSTDKATGGGEDLKVGTSWPVTVVAVGQQVHDDGTVTIDVSVPAADSDDLATAAASGTLVAVLNHPDTDE